MAACRDAAKPPKMLRYVAFSLDRQVEYETGNMECEFAQGAIATGA